jgi:hypothetical protein
LTISYLAFLAHLPVGFSTVRDIRPGKNEIVVEGGEPGQALTVPASGLAAARVA